MKENPYILILDEFATAVCNKIGGILLKDYKPDKYINDRDFNNSPEGSYVDLIYLSEKDRIYFSINKHRGNPDFLLSIYKDYKLIFIRISIYFSKLFEVQINEKSYFDFFKKNCFNGTNELIGNYINSLVRKKKINSIKQILLNGE